MKPIKALLLLMMTRGEHALVTGSSITAEDWKKKNSKYMIGRPHVKTNLTKITKLAHES